MSQRRHANQIGAGQFVSEKMHHSRMRVLAVGVVLLLGSSFVFAPPSFAVQAPPRVSASIYVATSSTTTAESQGCNQGTADAVSPIQSSEVILDFGGQLASGTGTQLIDTTQLTYSQITAYADAFARGYYVCTGTATNAILTLALGTNNDIPPVTGASGTAWANSAVAAARTLIVNHGYGSQVTVAGASDLEQSYSLPGPATAWVNGFSGTGVGRLINYGSAVGCSYTTWDNSGTCNNTWKQSDVYYMSWGNSSAYAFPELYGPDQSHAWTMISRYGYYYKGSRIYFDGPFTQNGWNNSYLSITAWNQFWTELNSDSSTASNFTYRTDI